MPIATSDFLIFLTASLTLNLTPGNDMMFVLGQSLRSGLRAGVAASLGIATGSLVHLCLVALGLAVVLNRHPLVFDVIRFGGAIYLLWIAYNSLSTTPVSRVASGPPRSAFAAWRDGTLVNLLNPKIIVFMFAFLPPFVHPENGSPLLQLFILGMVFNIGGTLINFCVAAFAGRAGEALAENMFVARWFSRISAGLFVILAARLVLDRH